MTVIELVRTGPSGKFLHESLGRSYGRVRGVYSRRMNLLRVADKGEYPHSSIDRDILPHELYHLRRGHTGTTTEEFIQDEIEATVFTALQLDQKIRPKILKLRRDMKRNLDISNEEFDRVLIEVAPKLRLRKLLHPKKKRRERMELY